MKSCWLTCLPSWLCVHDLSIAFALRLLFAPFRFKIPHVSGHWQDDPVTSRSYGRHGDLNLQVFGEISNLRCIWLLELCITTSCFCAGIYCTKNRMSQCVSMMPQSHAMIWREKKGVGGSYAEADSNSACLAGLFLAPISILITRVTPSVLKILRGSFLYLLHFQELQEGLHN